MTGFLRRFRPFLLYAGLFSLFSNLLLLIPALYMLQVYDRVLTSRSSETLILLTVSATIALAVMMLLDLLRTRLLAIGSLLLDKWLGPVVLQYLFSSKRDPAVVPVNGLRDVELLRGFLTGPGVLALLDAPWMLVFVSVIFLFHPLLGVIAAGGALALLGLTVLNERLMRKPLGNLQQHGRASGHFIDLGLRNAEVVTALGMTSSLTRRWEAHNDRVLELQSTASRRSGFMSSLTKFLRQLLQVGMLGAGAYLVIDQHVSGGVMIAATILLGRALAPVELLIAGWKSLIDARGALQRLDKLLAARDDATVPTELPVPTGHLALERVVFAVKGREKPILKGISFELAAGETLGIIGPTASGKSTIARLIVGVWKPHSGTLRLDGADIANWPRERIGPYMGYVPQDVELFAGTIAENIARLGEVNSAAVVKAAQHAHAHDMILRLPLGYDTPVGEGGAALAGGQRQRIALARALYGDPRLIVLDEPNANLDGDGEEALSKTLRDVGQSGVTLVVITHRPSLLINCEADKLLVLNDGAIEMFGPLKEIMARVTRRLPTGNLAVAGQIGARES
jgi:ATP-binding cassette subfamily C exporter for protease/lipase/ATP-binding cassette subfamily C protein EexD